MARKQTRIIVPRKPVFVPVEPTPVAQTENDLDTASDWRTIAVREALAIVTDPYVKTRDKLRAIEALDALHAN